jgi:hypothetical protein
MKSNILYILRSFLLFSSIIVSAAGCGSSGGSFTNGSGSIVVKLSWNDNSTRSLIKNTAKAPTGVTTVRIIVTGTGMTDLQKDFPAADGNGVVDGIPSGSGRTVKAHGLDVNGLVTYQGEVGNITIQAGHVTDAGIIVMQSTTSNSAPVANAGTAQNSVIGALVTLDGSASSDANSDPLTYAWSVASKPDGSSAALSSTTVAKPTFTPDVAGAYTLNLIVNDGKVNSVAATVTVTVTAASTVTVEVDTSQSGGAVRDLFGANKKPTFSSQTPGVNWNAASLYPVFGVSQVRLHDSNVDLCETYTAATKLSIGTTSTVAVTGCEVQGTNGRPHFSWTPTSSADADLNNPNNYDFTSVDEALSGVIATGATVYLRLGESFNGPNDTGDPVAWAKVATNIYKHVLGIFKPTAGIAVNPAYVEIFNEPDGGFWAGSTATFDTLFVETAQRVRAAAATAGKTVKVGGAGFTRNILSNSKEAGNVANGFIGAVGASTIDFYSAHHYGSCDSSTLSSSANFLRALRTVVNTQGGSSKPLHITEWNIGLGSQCGNDYYANQRTQSFDSGILTLMQDPAQNIEAAHYYAAMPIMALFDFATVTGTTRINPSAWAFWAHSKLRGATSVSTQVCPQGGACVAGYAAESAPVLAFAGQSNGVQNIVITNDGIAEVTYKLRVKGLNSGSVTASISTPPSGARDLPASGNPIVADTTALTALIASVTKDTRAALPVSGGQVELTVTIPAHTLQLVEVRAQ